MPALKFTVTHAEISEHKVCVYMYMSHGDASAREHQCLCYHYSEAPRILTGTLNLNEIPTLLIQSHFSIKDILPALILLNTSL